MDTARDVTRDIIGPESPTDGETDNSYKVALAIAISTLNN